MTRRPKRSLMCKLMCLFSPNFRDRVEATDTVITYLKIRDGHSYRRYDWTYGMTSPRHTRWWKDQYWLLLGVCACIAIYSLGAWVWEMVF